MCDNKSICMLELGKSGELLTLSLYECLHFWHFTKHDK